MDKRNTLLDNFLFTSKLELVVSLFQLGVLDQIMIFAPDLKGLYSQKYECTQHPCSTKFFAFSLSPMVGVMVLYPSFEKKNNQSSLCRSFQSSSIPRGIRVVNLKWRLHINGLHSSQYSRASARRYTKLYGRYGYMKQIQVHQKPTLCTIVAHLKSTHVCLWCIVLNLGLVLVNRHGHTYCEDFY